jgi:2-polyprenyl-3-methyl-5-hydroxy-6-metoxy-1,4-benzoquinol methylase
MSALSTGLQEFLDDATSAKSTLRILEAGCGSRTNIRFDDRVHWVGIDISAAQLERNNGLREKIHADVQTYEFPNGDFDMIVCWDVLEHLETPEAALRRFAEAVKPGGLIVLKIPNLDSMKGRLTRALPHGVHVAWYQYVHGRRYTDREDGGPFRTFLRSSIAPSALRRFAAESGLDVPFEAYYDVSNVVSLRRKKAALLAYKAAKSVVGLLSMGKLGDSEYIIVMQRRA